MSAPETAESAPSPAAAPEPPARGRDARAWAISLTLLALTLLSTLYVGAGMHGIEVTSLGTLWAGADFALPLLGILVTHELGHYVAGRIHRVDISPPYFIPMPFVLLGTMGAVIRQRGAIRSSDALLDVGASGPLAGMAVAVPVLLYGLSTSTVEPLSALPEAAILEGHSLLYELALYVTHGPIPDGQDIFLTPTAFAGWAGLLVTMMNLLPIAQLDGGHVAFALFGKRQNTYSRVLLALLPVAAVAASGWYLAVALRAGASGDALWNAGLAGVHWLVWFAALLLMSRFSGLDHPPAGDRPLSTGRRIVAIGTLVLFVLLFMPSWVRQA
ncbi:MAG: site-2 protease family protein [Sandaracinus sp.]